MRLAPNIVVKNGKIAFSPSKPLPSEEKDTLKVHLNKSNMKIFERCDKSENGSYILSVRKNTEEIAKAQNSYPVDV